ncbi:hypothetical protein [Leucobacter tenebrionis]|nr:hypothetical protein [Leucobacter tenebrionis]QZY51336.1 hypothetical protein KVY00_12210 [Leucobacter tenebrionis]
MIADACTTRLLESDVAPVSEQQLHEAALATIGEPYGRVRTADEPV